MTRDVPTGNGDRVRRAPGYGIFGYFDVASFEPEARTRYLGRPAPLANE
jgi:hypothetical protein